MWVHQQVCCDKISSINVKGCKYQWGIVFQPVSDSFNQLATASSSTPPLSTSAEVTGGSCGEVTGGSTKSAYVHCVNIGGCFLPIYFLHIHVPSPTITYWSFKSSLKTIFGTDFFLSPFLSKFLCTMALQLLNLSKCGKPWNMAKHTNCNDFSFALDAHIGRRLSLRRLYLWYILKKIPQS